MALAAVSAGSFWQGIEFGITIGAMYALIALGYTLVYGILELINFAHGDVFMWSSVITFAVARLLHLDSHGVSGFAVIGGVFLLLVIGIGSCAGLNIAIERVAYRRLRHAPRLAPLISAIGVSFVLETVALLWRGSQTNAFPALFPAAAFTLGPAHIRWLDVVIVALAVALMIGLDRYIRLTPMGLSMRALAQHPEAAALMGVNANQIITFTFGLGGALAGAAGVIYNLYVGQVKYDIGFQAGLIAFTAAVLGGIGNVRGAVLGGFVIGIIQSLTILFVPNGSAWLNVTVFSVLVLILIVRPAGLLGQQVPEKV